jgi:hypothetical protein
VQSLQRPLWWLLRARAAEGRKQTRRENMSSPFFFNERKRERDRKGVEEDEKRAISYDATYICNSTQIIHARNDVNL